MNAPMNFAFRDQQMRIVMIDDAPWWVANDLCTILDIRNSRMAVARIPEDMRRVSQTDTSAGPRSTNVVSEPGMWMLVMRSDKPEAQELILWLAREVLPALRKTGRYEMPGHEPPPVQAMDMDSNRMEAVASVVRLGLRLYGPRAARSLWLQVGLPPIVLDSETVIDIDPLAEPLLCFLETRAQTTLQQAAEGIGIINPDWSTRQRLGRMLAMWGWQNKTEKVGRKAVRVYRRPSQMMEAQA